MILEKKKKTKLHDAKKKKKLLHCNLSTLEAYRLEEFIVYSKIGLDLICVKFQIKHKNAWLKGCYSEPE